MHSDDKGLVLPPRVAPVQVCIVPCGLRSGSNKQEILALCEAKRQELQALGIRAVVSDDEDGGTSVGFRISQHEFEGIPLRLEIGPSELATGRIKIKKRTMDTHDLFVNSMHEVPGVLDEIHSEMHERAQSQMQDLIIGPITSRQEMVPGKFSI